MPDLSRLAPPGIDLKLEAKLLLGGCTCAFLYSLGFFIRLSRGVEALYRIRNGVKTLMTDAVMEDFHGVLGTALTGFFVIAFCMLCLIAYHYAYHRQGSRSIYLMRRLPDRLELHRRCITLPVISAVLCVAAAFILLLIYYAIYMAAVPKECLQAGQWQLFWRELL